VEVVTFTAFFMRVYTTLHMGAFHTHHCEDYLFTDALSTNTHLFIVMDGCSSGTDSQFATALSARIFRKIAREISYKAFLEKQTLSLVASAFDKGQYATQYDIPNYLLCDTNMSETAYMLHRKVIDIQEQAGLKPMDDLAIIRSNTARKS